MEKITIKNENLSVSVLTLGAIVQNITAFGVSVAAGFDSEEEYLADTCYFGACVGRTANRTGNDNNIDGVIIPLPLNENGVNHLHGGVEGFNRKRFTVTEKSDASVTLNYFSPDGEEGYPGNLDLYVTYKLVGDALLISYKATTDKPTWVNLTNHTYFNPHGINNELGAGFGGVAVSIYADKVSTYDENNRVIGDMPVKATEFDLNQPTLLQRFYDHNFYLNGDEYKDFSGISLRKAGEMKSVIGIKCYTDAPCMQLYCGEFIPENTVISGGTVIGSGSAMCFETQLEPNFQSKGENILRPDGVYETATAYVFSKTDIRIGSVK